jgi:hypothetical protein
MTYCSNDDNAIFHPKLLIAKQVNGANIIVGSASFTLGGLLKNHECSRKARTPF